MKNNGVGGEGGEGRGDMPLCRKLMTRVFYGQLGEVFLLISL